MPGRNLSFKVTVRVREERLPRTFGSVNTPPEAGLNEAVMALRMLIYLKQCSGLTEAAEFIRLEKGKFSKFNR